MINFVQVLMKTFSLFIILFLGSQSLFANKTASEIYLDLEKLYSLKRVLYIAAHPDDENTRFLAYMSLGEKAETAYFSLTRGDGGQNLIGNELGDKLGVLRTQELLAARSFDRAKQYFARAVDFGYSKSAEESLEKWGEKDILSDVVLMIRQFKPDVIITRFPPDKRGGHGHHTASAMLAIEAFEKAAQPDFLPEQVKQYGTWQATSLYWNTSSWWMDSIEDSLVKYPDQYLKIDIGGYNSQLGMSYNEIGTIARSQHKCQGFGAVVERGERMEYFEYLAGEKLQNSFFEKNDKTWKSIVSADFEKTFAGLISNFDFLHLESNIDALLKIQKGLVSLPESNFKNEKLSLCNEIIINSLGLYIEVLSDDYFVVQNDSAKFNLSILNRSGTPVTGAQVKVNGEQVVMQSKMVNAGELFECPIQFINKHNLTTPYWLQNEFINLFQLENEEDRGRAESEPTFASLITLKIKGQDITVLRKAEYKWRDPSYGERRREVISSGEFACNFEENIHVLKPEQHKTVRFSVKSFSDFENNSITIDVPKAWDVSPATFNLGRMKKGEEKWFEFDLMASENSVNGEIYIKDDKGLNINSYHEVVYDHIPTQVIQSKTVMQCVKIDAKIIKGKVAYIKGVEDAVPLAIQQLGFEVDQFEVNSLANLDLSIYQTVVLGIRIYNVHPELFNYQDLLSNYVKEGGNLIMQYNTASRDFTDKEFGPLPFKVSRNRVTEEDATVTFLDGKHPILNTPNELNKDDFNGWVQERGLYYASDWSQEFKPLFSWHDKGEDPQEGALIVAKFGKGQFIYTGISFFRELPNGVPGAYRLFANMLSYQSE